MSTKPRKDQILYDGFEWFDHRVFKTCVLLIKYDVNNVMPQSGRSFPVYKNLKIVIRNTERNLSVLLRHVTQTKTFQECNKMKIAK